MERLPGNAPSSETTGFRSLGEIQPSGIGRLLGEIGSVAVPTVVSTGPEEVSVAANDQALQALLKQQCGLLVEVHERTMFPAGGGFYSVPEGVDFHVLGPDLPKWGLAWAILDTALGPAPRKDLARELTRLRMLTKVKERGTVDAELEVLVWLDELSRYPGDVAIETLREWPRQPQGMWWPSWHEMEERLRRKAAPRRAMVNKLREAA